MFSWRWKRPEKSNKADTNPAAIAACIEASARLGELLEAHPGSVMDTKILPVPLPVMKIALQTAWKIATSQEQKEEIEVCYLNLANFQDGVGAKPIDLMSLSAEDDPNDVVFKLGLTMPWINKTTEDMKALKLEFEAFKRTQKI